MLKKIPALVFLFVLAVVAVAVPLACSSSSTATPDANTDLPAEKAPIDMTHA